MRDTLPELRPEDWMSPNAFPRSFEAGLSVVDACFTEVLECSFALGREWMAALNAADEAALIAWEVRDYDLFLVEAEKQPPEVAAPKSAKTARAGAAAA